MSLTSSAPSSSSSGSDVVDVRAPCPVVVPPALSVPVARAPARGSPTTSPTSSSSASVPVSASAPAGVGRGSALAAARLAIVLKSRGSLLLAHYESCIKVYCSTIGTVCISKLASLIQLLLI